MAVTLEAFGIDKMGVEDRVELLHLILDTLPEPVREAIHIPEWHKEILAKRLADAKANPGAGRPYKEVLAELEARQ